MTETARRYMGNSVPRKEDPALLTGRSNFTDDIRLPGMLHMAVLRSPHAHARITAIGRLARQERPGVVVTSDDLAGGGGAGEEGRVGDGCIRVSARTFCGWPVTEDIKIPDHWPLARDEVNLAVGSAWPWSSRPTATRPRTPSSSSRWITSRWPW